MQDVAEVWSQALVKYQFDSGLDDLFKFFPGADQMDEKIVHAICTFFPWTPAPPHNPARIFKDAYCSKAIPAMIKADIERKKAMIKADIERKKAAKRREVAAFKMRMAAAKALGVKP